jgi:hypothetical protein
MEVPCPGDEACTKGFVVVENDLELFEKVFGIKELVTNNVEEKEAFVQANFGLKAAADGDGFELHCNASQRCYRVGALELLSVEQLRTMADKLPRPGKCTLTLVVGDGGNTHKQADVDVVELQAANPGAVFQTASNSNALEMHNPHVGPLYGLTYYVEDKTQGPAAMMSTFPAAFYRTFLVEHMAEHTPSAPSRRNQSATQHGQLRHQLSLFSDTSPRIIEQNGYVFPHQQPNGTAEALVSSWAKCKVALQRRNEVVIRSRREPSGFTLFAADNASSTLSSAAQQPPRRVTQVACCAADLSRSLQPSESEFNRVLASSLLKAAYHGTLLAAAISAHDPLNATFDARNKVFLTLVGAGSFCNPLDMVLDTLCDAVVCVGVPFGLDIQLVVFDVDTLHISAQELVGEVKKRLAPEVTLECRILCS